MKLFEISLEALNLFSFILGMLYAMVYSYGFYGRRNMWFTVVLYFIGIAIYYYLIAKHII